jgi:hypothetical protein
MTNPCQACRLFGVPVRVQTAASCQHHRRGGGPWRGAQGFLGADMIGRGLPAVGCIAVVPTTFVTAVDHGHPPSSPGWPVSWSGAGQPIGSATLSRALWRGRIPASSTAPRGGGAARAAVSIVQWGDSSGHAVVEEAVDDVRTDLGILDGVGQPRPCAARSGRPAAHQVDPRPVWAGIEALKTEPASRPRPHPGSGRTGVSGRGCSVAWLDGAARPPGLVPGGAMSPFARRGGLASPSAVAHGSPLVASAGR